MLKSQAAGAAQSVGSLAAKSAMAATATSRINAGMAGVGRASGAAGYRIMQLGQTMDDLQYVGEMGIRPIINNIMQIAPAAGIALIGINQIINNWDQVREIFRDTAVGDALDTIGEKADELGRKFGLIRDKVKDSADAIKEGMSSAADTIDAVGAAGSGDRGGAVRDAIAQAGGGAAFRQRLIAEEVARIGPEAANREFRQADGKTLTGRQLSEAKINGIMANALKGDESAIRNLTDMAGGNFGANYTAALPETKQAAADAQRRAEEAAAEREKIAEDRRKRTEAEQQRMAEQAAAGFRPEYIRRESAAGAMGPDLPAADRRAIMHGQLRDRLTASGLSTEDANAAATGALDKLAAELDTTVREKMAGGLSRSEALGSLAEQDRLRQQAEAERARSEALQLAGERAPNLVRQAATAFDNSVRLNGADPRATGEILGRQITAELQRRGLSAEQARTAAGQYVGDAQQSTGMKLFDMLNDPEKFAKLAGQMKGPEVFSAESLYARVQAGVGGPEDKAEQQIRAIANGNQILARIETAIEDAGFGARAQ